MTRFALRPFVALSLAVVLVGSAGVATWHQAMASGERSDPTCTPDIVYTLFPGETDLSGSGTGYVSFVSVDLADGGQLPATGGHLEWNYRAIVRPEGVSQRLGGFIEATVRLDSGEVVTFTSQCMAGVGSIQNSRFGYALIYANGLVKGWPGGGVQRALIHFEVATFADGSAEAYAALVQGKDCSLDHDLVIWDPDESYLGTGSYSGANGPFVYSETDCGISKSGHRLRSAYW